MRTRTRTILAGLVLAAALVGGVAWATGPISSVVAADGTINGCYRATNGDDDNGGKGQLRVVAAGESCKKNERSITWSQKGVKGEPGAAGANGLAGRDGAPGAKGETGAAGADGTNGTNGTDGSDGAQGAKGDPCLATDPACVGPKGETGAAGRDGVDGAPGAVGPTGPPGSGSGSLASLDALGGTSCNAAGNPGTVVVSYGPPPVGAITLACKPTANGTVLVSKIGAGSGTVTSNIGGIDCGTTCVRTFTTGTVVTLTATAASGDDFVGWLGGGGCSGTGTCTVTATGLVTVSAHFEPHVPTSLLYLVYTKRDSTDTVEVTPTAAATNCDFGGDPRDPSVTTFFCNLRFLAGTTVTLRAGNSRVVWSGACAGTTGVTCTLTLDADKSVGATFPEF